MSDSEKPVFKVPVSYRAIGCFFVKADNQAEAIAIVRENRDNKHFVFDLDRTTPYDDKTHIHADMVCVIHPNVLKTLGIKPT